NAASVESASANPKDAIGRKKVPLRLVPPALAIYVAKVLEFGAFLKKPKPYGPYNWRETGVNMSVYIEAQERHLQALKDGEFMDPEHGFPHFASIAANSAIALDAWSLGKLIDDR